MSSGGQAGVCSLRCFIAFYSRRTRDGCWIPVRPIEWHGKVYRPHHISYVTYNGKVPKGRRVIRICDTKCCVNPLHLGVSQGKTISEQVGDEVTALRGTLRWLKEQFVKFLFRHRNI